MDSQQDLFSPTIAQQFEAWRQTPGGKHLLRHAYRIAAGLLKRTPPGQRLSVKLVWELLRHKYRWICAGLKRRGIAPHRVNGFALNNIFTAYVARHMMNHRADWAGRFEVRELNRVKPKRVTEIKITEVRAAPAKSPKPEARPAEGRFNRRELATSAAT